VLRDWQMWRTGCRRDAGMGNGHWEILPSVQLAIAALMLSDKQSDAKQRAADRAEFPWNKPADEDSCIMDLASYKPSDSPASTFGTDDARMWKWLRNRSGLPHASEVEKPSDATIALTNRVFFRYRYRQEPSPVLLIPALAILKHAPHSNLAKNGVVVIGQSFEAAHDLHATPIGVMPGSMVLINSLESMLNPGLLQEPGWAGRLAIEGTSIAVVGFFLAYLDYVIAVIVILTLFVPLLIILNYFLLLDGIWMDFAIPLLGMYMHKIIAELEAYRPRRREHRLASSTHVHTEKEETDAID
jgi:CHASE2 domain